MSLASLATPLTPHFGCILTAITIQEVLQNATLLEELPSLIFQHRFVLFRPEDEEKNVMVTPDEHIRLSKALGTIESTFYKHPKSPHPDIFRVSNDDKEGCTNVGRTGWHCDGTFLQRPFKFQTMHFPSASNSGFTQLLPLKEFLASVPEEVQARWRRTVFVSDSSAHRLVYRHPDTGDDTMVFHLGRHFCKGWLEFASQPPVVVTGGEQNDVAQISAFRDTPFSPSTSFVSQQFFDKWAAASGGPPSRTPATTVIDELQKYIDLQLEVITGSERQCASEAPTASECGTGKLESLVHTMKWKTNDFAILDNRALVHYAVPDTQLDRDQDGLRILHRTTMMD